MGDPSKTSTRPKAIRERWEEDKAASSLLQSQMLSDDSIEEEIRSHRFKLEANFRYCKYRQTFFEQIDFMLNALAFFSCVCGAASSASWILSVSACSCCLFLLVRPTNKAMDFNKFAASSLALNNKISESSLPRSELLNILNAKEVEDELEQPPVKQELFDFASNEVRAIWTGEPVPKIGRIERLMMNI
jgi:hypothetical protein